MISPAAASSGWMPAAAAQRDAELAGHSRSPRSSCRVSVLRAGRFGQEIAGDARVLAGGALGDAEQQGQVAAVGPPVKDLSSGLVGVCAVYVRAWDVREARSGQVPVG